MKHLFTNFFISLTFLLFGASIYGQSNDLNSTEDKNSDKSVNQTKDVVVPTEPLFEVKNEQGFTVFAVYPNGVKIFIDEQFKATGGGFTVGRLGTGKSTSDDFFQVYPGDVRVNIYDNGEKATGGGFTVGRLGTGKALETDFLTVGPGNVRVNIPQNLDKATGGGFTVGRLGTGKAGADDVEFMTVTPDSTRISISEAGSLSNGGGFAISKLGATRAEDEKFFKLNENNAFFGHNSGNSNTTGLYNAFLGYESGIKNTVGQSNTFVGYNTGNANISGNQNVFVGEKAGYSNVSGHLNTFLGTYTGFANTESNYSTYVGYEAGKNAVNGFNTCVGYSSGTLGSAGTKRAFLGYGAGNNSVGDDNTYIGAEAGFSSYNGTQNVYIGTGAGKSASGSGNILIGYNAGLNIESSNTLVIENSSSSSPLIFGDFNQDLVQINGKFGVGRYPATNHFEVEGYASKTVAGSWIANSDKRIKTEITDITNAFDVIMSLHPVKFKYTDEWKKRNPSIEDRFYYNYIAQEYQKVFPESVKGSGEYLNNDKTEILQVDPYNAQIVSIKAIQDLISQNTKQQAEIESLKALVNQLSAEKQVLNEKQQSLEAKIDGINDQLDNLKSMILQTGK